MVEGHITPVDVTSTCDGFLYCMGQWAYNVTDGMFWTFMLAGFCIVMYMATFRFGTPRAFGFASVVGLLGAIWLVILNYMPVWIASLFVITGLVGFAVMIISNR